jgi:Zn-dependent protease
MDVGALVHGISIWALPVIIAITSHEAAHGWVAWKLGDDTAKRLGRVTFNPINHIDTFGTLILPGVLILASQFTSSPFVFGWAKPVPVDFGRLRNPRRDMVWVAAAGPGINLILATIAIYLLSPYAGPIRDDDWLRLNFRNAAEINLILAVFNMIPLPPLDGGRVAVGLLPRAAAYRLAQLERFGLLTIIALLFVLPMVGRQLGVSLDILPWLVGGPVDFLFEVIAWLVG